MRLGLSLFGSLSLEEIRTLSIEAEEAGFESVWVAEGTGTDAFSACAIIAENTTKVALGTDIVSVYTRHPCVLASASAALDRLSRGRFRLGLGVSDKSVVEGQLGLKFSRPVKRMQETIQLIRKIIASKNASFRGEIFSVSNYSLWAPPYSKSIRIYVAGSGPKMIELIASESDGSLFFLKNEDALRTAIATIRAVCEAKQRKVDVGLVIPCALHSDDSVAFDSAAITLAFYITKFSVYVKSLSDQGYSEVVANIIRDPHNAASKITHEMVDDLCLSGDTEKIGEKIERLQRLGIDLLILEPCSFPGEELFETLRRTIELGKI